MTDNRLALLAEEEDDSDIRWVQSVVGYGRGGGGYSQFWGGFIGWGRYRPFSSDRFFFVNAFIRIIISRSTLDVTFDIQR
jgi:hypothetical protein